MSQTADSWCPSQQPVGGAGLVIRTPEGLQLPLPGPFHGGLPSGGLGLRDLHLLRGRGAKSLVSIWYVTKLLRETCTMIMPGDG